MLVSSKSRMLVPLVASNTSYWRLKSDTMSHNRTASLEFALGEGLRLLQSMPGMLKSPQRATGELLLMDASEPFSWMRVL